MPRGSILTAIIQLERWTPVDILANQRIDNCIRTSFLLPTSYFLLPTSYFLLPGKNRSYVVSLDKAEKISTKLLFVLCAPEDKHC